MSGRASDMAVRVRFAPSPTGFLHIGGLRTALFCYLFARAQGGTFVLRIEDTDRSRFVTDAEEDIVACLSWAGLTVDEGPHLGPGYRQSERTALYHRYAQELLVAGHAYHAFDTPEALQAMRDQGAAYDRATRCEMDNAFTQSPEEVQRRIERGEPHVLRLCVPESGRIVFADLIKGVVEFSANSLDDQVLLKSDRQPTYHLANVVDDHLMGITHVIRGEEGGCLRRQSTCCSIRPLGGNRRKWRTCRSSWAPMAASCRSAVPRAWGSP